MRKISGTVEATTDKRGGAIKIKGNWYDLTEKTKPYAPKKNDNVEIEIDDRNKIQFIRKLGTMISNGNTATVQKEVEEPKVERRRVYTYEEIEAMVAGIKQRLSEDLTFCLVAVQDAILESNQKTQRKTQFTSEDIAKMTNAMFIQLQRERAILKRNLSEVEG